MLGYRGLKCFYDSSTFWCVVMFYCLRFTVNQFCWVKWSGCTSFIISPDNTGASHPLLVLWLRPATTHNKYSGEETHKDDGERQEMRLNLAGKSWQLRIQTQNIWKQQLRKDDPRTPERSLRSRVKYIFEPHSSRWSDSTSAHTEKGHLQMYGKTSQWLWADFLFL